MRRRILTVADPPPASANLAAVENSNIVPSWAGPDDAGITGYQILRRGEDDNAMLVHVEDTGNTATTHTDTDVAD
jgi:hypothetical protein